jgi:hypothetical protein
MPTTPAVIGSVRHWRPPVSEPHRRQSFAADAMASSREVSIATCLLQRRSAGAGESGDRRAVGQVPRIRFL